MNKKVLAAAVSGVLVTPMAAHAVKYKLSGQINRAVVYQNDGQQSDVQFVDNFSSGTRWRMTGSEDIGNGMKVGFNWEWQRSSNPSKPGGAIKSAAITPDGEALRKAEVWFSGGWGKVSLGQGDGAGNGTTEIDLTSTFNVTYVSRDSFGGAVAWRTSGGSTIAGGLTHGQTFDHWDAFSRYDRIRYDSPTLGPVTVSVSAGQADLYEGAARWSQDLGDGQISAGVFYGKQNNVAKNRFGGSAAYLFSFGTNLLVSYGENENDPAAGVSSLTSKNWYVKVGHNWGNNSVSASYGESKDVVDGFNDKGFQLGFNHNLPKVKVDLYAGIQQNTLDVPGGTPGVDDIWTVAAGTKLKFN